MKTPLRWLIFAAVLGIGLSTALAFIVSRELGMMMTTPLASSGPALLRIAPGSTLRQIARQIETEGWVADYRLFVLRTRLDGIAQRLQAGTYAMMPGDTLADLLERLVTGRTKVFEITFIEGSRFTDLRRVLAAQPYVRHTLAERSDDDVMRELGLDAAAPEGLFFPATYYHDDGTHDIDILARAARRLAEVLAEAWRGRAADLPYASPYAALIMASIIEKETGLAEERQEVAGVFVRRLKLGMKLQTDPTVIYGLGADFDGDLRRTDLQRDHPYNTYVHTGLPPTPIAMPGRDAIVAALNPAAGTALYFVARGDGGHQFSTTLSEHNAAVRRYQLRR